MTEREHPPAPHRCACVVIEPGEVRNHCPQMVPEPDRPFCHLCARRHPEYPPSMKITAVSASYYQKRDEP